MLDKEVVKEFLDDQLDGIEVPAEISMRVLVETFCRYVEEDYYEWLKDNFKTFFNNGNPDWDWIKNMINKYKQE
ncbi:MAG: hypothetical protein QW728_02010 [Thermoplasmata archaeon]